MAEVAMVASSSVVVPISHTTPEADLYRQRFVSTVCEHGLDRALEDFKVSREVAEGWQSEEWWSDCSRRYYANEAAELDRRMTRVIRDALQKAETRLDSGDEVIDKFGDTHKVPVKGKDAAVIAALFLDKRQVLRGLPNSIVASQVRLDKVAEQLRGIVARDSVASVVVDGKALEDAALGVSGGNT